MSEQLKQSSQEPQMPPKTVEKTASPKVYKKPEETLIGQEISGCIILEKVSEGGMGTVFKAKHKALDRIVCVKILSPALSEDKKAVGLFLTEARAIAEIDHPNIVFVYNVGREKGFYFIVMSFIEGESLSSIVRKRPNLPISFVIETFMGILQGLEAAHQKGIIHRDIKPSNILINKKLEPKIVDFGIAKKVDKDKGHTKTTELAGTAYFLSPEQALGRPIDTRADLYSLGASLYYVLTAKYPFTGKNSMDIIQKHINEPVPDVLALRKNIPPWLGLAVSKLMSKNPNDRFQTATEALNYFKKMRADDQLKVSGGVNITEEVGLKVNLKEHDATPAARAASERLSNNRFNMNVDGIAPSATKPGSASNIVSLGDRSGGFSSASDGAQPSLVDNKQPDKTFTQKFIEQRKKQMATGATFELDPTTTLTRQKNKFLLTGFLYTTLAAVMLITAAVLFINLGAAGAAAVKVAGMPFVKAVFAPFLVENFITQNMIMVSTAFVFLIFTLSMIFFDVVRKCVGVVLAISVTAYISALYGLVDPDNTLLNFAATNALPVYTLLFCALAINLDDSDMLPITARFVSIILFLAGFACIYAYTAPQYFASGPMTTSLLYAALGLSAATIVIVFIRGSVIFRLGAVLLALLSCLSLWLYQSSGNNYFLMQEIEGRIKLEEQAAPQQLPSGDGMPAVPAPAQVEPQTVAFAPKIVLSGFSYTIDLLADDTPSVDGVPLTQEPPARRQPVAPKEPQAPAPLQPIQAAARELVKEVSSALQQPATPPQPQPQAQEPVAEVNEPQPVAEEVKEEPKVILSPQEKREQFITALAGQLSAKTKSKALAERQVWNFALREPYEKLMYSYKADNIAFLTIVLMVIYGILSFIISVLILREERWNLI